MMKLFYAFTISISLLLISCSKITTPNEGKIEQSAGQLSLSIDMKKAPEQISSLKGFLTKENQDTIYFDFIIKDQIAQATIENLTPGQWYLQVDAFDSNGNRIYTGSVNITVEAGKMTPIFLNLMQVLGSLDITVSWGGVPHDMMLLMAKNPAGEWRILLMKDDGSKIFDLVDGRYPIWTDDQRNSFVFLRGKDELCRFDLSTHRITTLTYLGVNANFLFYAPVLERILFDYKYYGDHSYPWQLASVNLNGQDFHDILNDNTKKKYPATPPNSDWIYYHVNHNGTFQIYRVKHDGSQNQPVISGDFHCEFPSFDRNGQRMVFSKISLDSTYKAVVIHDLYTNQEKEINVTELGQATYPAFTYDGQSVIFSVIVGPDHQDRQLFRYHIETGNLKQITFGHAYFWYARPIFW